MQSNHTVLLFALLLALSGSSALSQTPPNDNCSGAYTLYVPHIISGSTVGATVEPNYGACGNIAADVWFTFVAPFSGTATASTCPLLSAGSANFDTVIVIRQHVQ